MKKFLFIILPVFISCCTPVPEKPSYGIIDIATLSPAKGLKEYYEYVSKAEMKIVKSQPENAAELYAKAFSYKKAPFLKDDLNAFNVTMNFCSDTGLIKECLIRTIRFSALSSRELIVNVANRYPDTDSTFLYSLIPVLDTVTKPATYNDNLAKALDTMMQNDMDARLESPMNHAKVRRVDSVNLFGIMNLYEKYGDITTYNAGLYGLDQISTMLFHNHKRIHIWYPVLLEQVLKGNFPNKLFVDILTDYYRDMHGKPDKFAYYQGKAFVNKYAVIQLHNKKAKLINKIRKNLFLEPYMDQEKKNVWNFFNDEKKYSSFNFYPFDFQTPQVKYLQEDELNFFLQKQNKKLEELKKEFGDNLLIFDSYSHDFDFE